MGSDQFAAQVQGKAGGLEAPAPSPQPSLVAQAPGGSLPRLSGATFSSGIPLLWQTERAARLRRFCQAVERRRAAGVSVRKAIKSFAWYWKNRSYRTAPRIKARYSRSTLVMLYYRWCRNGRSPDCFNLQYVSRLAPVTPEQMQRFIDGCARAGTVSFTEAARLAGFEDGRANRILARLPERWVRETRKSFKGRRQARLEALEARHKYKRGIRRRDLAVAAAGRRIKRLGESFIGRRASGGIEATSFGSKGVIQTCNACCNGILQDLGRSPETNLNGGAQ